MHSADAVVVGGGMIGAAIAYGLARAGVATAMLDGDDGDLRAARGNFGLVWVQGKGLGMQRYAEWTRESADLWPEFAAELHENTGVDVAYDKPGGLDICLGDDQLGRLRGEVVRMTEQAGTQGYDCEIVDRRGVQALMPRLRLGDAVVGGAYCRHDGHVNPLHLLRALHAGFMRAGGRFFPGHRVTAIRRDGAAFVAETARGEFAAPRLVLAAGHGAAALAPMVGLDVPIRPERGQILVTERTRPILPLPLAGMRQTAEGTIMLGASNEDVGFDDRTTLEVTRGIAARAVATVPAIAGLRLVRSWGALRILTPDEFPVYEESPRFPGAFVVTSHSGVTLAAVNVRYVPSWIVAGETRPGFECFSARRFDVPATA